MTRMTALFCVSALVILLQHLVYIRIILSPFLNWSASIRWEAADSLPIEYIEALLRWAKDAKDWEAEIRDGLPEMGMLSYVVVNSGDYLRYALSDQDIEDIRGGKY